MECRTSMVGVRGTSATVGLQAGLPGPVHPPKSRSEKKSAENSFAPFLPKVIQNDYFRVGHGL